MAKVFIICEPTKRLGSQRVSSVDLTPAAEWGEPVILLRTDQLSIDTSSSLSQLHRKLKDFCDSDFLVPIGDPVLMCAASMIAGFYNEGRVRILKWDRILKKYYPISIDTEGSECPQSR